MGWLKEINELIQKVQDYLEGDALPVGLINDLVFNEQLRILINDYSRLSEKLTVRYEGTCAEFLYFITEIYTEEEINIIFFEQGLKRAVEDYFIRRGTTVSIVVISDPIPNNGQKITVYFGWTQKQSRKLMHWYTRLTNEEKKRAIENLGDIQDESLKKEIEMMRKNGN